MKYIDEYRNPRIAQKLLDEIRTLLCDCADGMVLMEVCGTHTMSIARAGIRRLLAGKIRLLSGPGCPVCVTPNHYLDKAVAYGRRKDVILATFGDMMKVPGSSSSLEKEKSKGTSVIVVYSPLDALKIAEQNPQKKIIFLGIGFETTAPTVAATIKIAREKNTKNFFVHCGHKLVPPAMKVLVNDPELRIDGFICPGHVSALIGSRPYDFIARDYGIPCVIAGFEPIDILQTILMLVRQIVGKDAPLIEIQYSRVVRAEGNVKALEMMSEVFEVTKSDEWRGLGTIPESGLKLNEHFCDFDAEENITVEVEETVEHPGCICGAILRGVKTPPECGLFKKVCTPENPIGACMVSSEGTCAAYYKYGV